MPLPAMLLPLIKGLAANGLTTLATAIAAKGKEKVEEVIGVKIPDTADELTGDKLLELRKAAFAHEEALHGFAVKKLEIEAESEKAGQAQVSDRWKADMASDNRLSKNIRPGTLIYLLAANTLFTILDSVPSFGIDIADVWVTIWADAFKVVLGAYFIGRTVEKGLDTWQGWKSRREAKP